MKNSGFIRKVDSLGRIVIPKEIRKQLKISDNSDLELFSDSSCITIKKPLDSCIICGSKNNLIFFKEKYFCNKCVENLEEIKNH